jgi:hypothetical protein
MKLLYNTETQLLQPYPRNDDGEVIGLDSVYHVYSVIQSEPPAFDAATHYLKPTEAVDHATKNVTRGWEVMAIERPPLTVTMRSFRLACRRSLWMNIEAVVEGISDADAKWEARQYIQTSPTVARNHPLVMQLAAALGLTDAQVDVVFEAAAVLDTSS